MKAVLFEEFGPPSVLKIVHDYPKPARKNKNDVLVQLYSTSVNPVDWKTRKGALPRFLVKKPNVLGGDLCGIVIDSESARFPPGSRVYSCTTGFRMWEKPGCYSEYYCAPEAHLAHLPSNVSLTDGGALPLACLTSWQMLDSAKLSPGDRVLIHAGAGGVGSIAIQLAKARQLYVITTCSTRNIEFVKELGADEAIDYTTQDFVQILDGNPVDAVLELVGGSTETRSFNVLKKSGVLVSALNFGFKMMKSKFLHMFGMAPNARLVFVTPSGDELEKIGKLIEEGKIKVIIDKKLPLDKVVEAHEYMEKGHARGKVVLLVKEDE